MTMDKPTDGRGGVETALDAEHERAEAPPEQEPADDAAVDETAAARKEVEMLTVRLQRLQADFDNFRRRSRTEAEQLSLFVSAGLVGRFLPVMDNFERALASSADNQDAESLRKGFELIYRQLEKGLTDAGVEKINALGEQFSPQLHEAVMRSQNPDLPDGQIDCVVETGYRLKEKVIRPSKVRVVNNS